MDHSHIAVGLKVLRVLINGSSKAFQSTLVTFLFNEFSPHFIVAQLGLFHGGPIKTGIGVQAFGEHKAIK